MSELLYAIVGHDVPDSLPLRRELRPRHLDHLRALQDEGRLIAAGPRPAVDAIDPDAAGYAGSVVIAAFDNIDDARAWADADPYMLGGVFERVDVFPFVRALPA
ncbi:YciI family protein [Algiphilus sp.]|uniref:YciI family protein n=1 Tax=Algiphilus sp. TaxID=1872431 RepID=UPI0025C6244B|nr:YciI family protein [Algiphilus sp.]MCK5770890.1 YciI family protein [Algiphilus sp.]